MMVKRKEVLRLNLKCKSYQDQDGWCTTFSDYDIGIIGKDVKDDIGVRTKKMIKFNFSRRNLYKWIGKKNCSQMDDS